MHKNQGEIEAVIVEAYRSIPPAERAARKLFAKGVKEEDITKVIQHSVVEDVKLYAVRNALRDLWKGIKS